VGEHGAVGERELERADALLLRDEAGHGAVHLVHEEPLRPYGKEAQHAVGRGGHGQRRRERERAGRARHAVAHERLAGHLPQHQRHRHVDRRAVVGGVV